MEFKFIVKGDHPVFKRIDRRCLSYEEAENVETGLLAVGYECSIELINKLNSRGQTRS